MGLFGNDRRIAVWDMHAVANHGQGWGSKESNAYFTGRRRKLGGTAVKQSPSEESRGPGW